jgi:hypothetical protein
MLKKLILGFTPKAENASHKFLVQNILTHHLCTCDECITVTFFGSNRCMLKKGGGARIRRHAELCSQRISSIKLFLIQMDMTLP